MKSNIMVVTRMLSILMISNHYSNQYWDTIHIISIQSLSFKIDTSVKQINRCLGTIYENSRVLCGLDANKGVNRVTFSGCGNTKAGLILQGDNEGNCLRVPWSFALLPLKCSSTNLQFHPRMPFTKKKMPWCPCPFKNEAYSPAMDIVEGHYVDTHSPHTLMEAMEACP